MRNHLPDLEDLQQAIADDAGEGFCLSCGEWTEGVEPDARNYECESCGARRVFGAEELLLRNLYKEG
jgi:hypothetical protein